MWTYTYLTTLRWEWVSSCGLPRYTRTFFLCQPFLLCSFFLANRHYASHHKRNCEFWLCVKIFLKEWVTWVNIYLAHTQFSPTSIVTFTCHIWLVNYIYSGLSGWKAKRKHSLIEFSLQGYRKAFCELLSSSTDDKHLQEERETYIFLAYKPLYPNHFCTE